MNKARERIAGTLGRGGGSEVDRLRAQVNRVQRELAGLADTLGDTLDGETIVRRAEAFRDRTAEEAARTARYAEAIAERTADEVARRARQAAGTAREHPFGTGFAVVLVVGLLALLFSRR